MKPLIIFFFCIIFQNTIFAQDILVKSNGEKISCRIVGMDSAIVSYENEDTTKKEIVLIPKGQILAVKRNSEKMILFFVPDTLINSNGDKIICKVTAIDPGFISYLPMDSSIEDLKIVPDDKFAVIHFGNGSRETVEQKTGNEFSGKVDYYQLGEIDAKKYYKAKGIIAAEAVCGLGTYFLVGIIGGAIIYSLPPKNLSDPANPHNDLLNSNPDYYSGYLHAAQNIKHKKAALGYVAGVFAPVAILAVAITVAVSQNPNPL